MVDRPMRSILDMRFVGPALICAASLGLTLWASNTIAEAERESARLRFENRIDRVRNAISERMAAYEQVLRGGVALFNASSVVNNETWRIYVAGLEIDNTYPGIQGIGFSLRVAPDEREAHVLEMRARGFPDYELWPEGERDIYTAIIYLEPFDFRNRRAFGYDMMSEPTRRAAMERARDQGGPAASGSVTLKQETEDDVQAGFLTYLPVYRPGEPASTVAERRSSLFGFVYSPFRLNDLMRGILGTDQIDVILRIYDGSETLDEARIFSSDTWPEGAMFARSVPLDFSGHMWTLELASSPHFENALDNGKSDVVLILGLIISALLAAVAWLMATTRDKALRIANDMTGKLRTSETEVRGLNRELEKRVSHRTAELELANRELESFAYSVSHDLRAPLRGIHGFSQALMEDHGDKLDDSARQYLDRIMAAATRMGRLIDDLLLLSRVSRAELNRQSVGISDMAESIIQQLRETAPQRTIAVAVEPGMHVMADGTLVRTILENLLGNAWKYSAKNPDARIEFGARQDGKGTEDVTYFVRDNGVGFDMGQAENLFKPFHRLHSESEFEGNGIGLASAANIVRKHGGKIWADAEPGAGATIQFTLPS